MKEHIETILKYMDTVPTKAERMQIVASSMALAEEIVSGQDIPDELLELFDTQDKKQALLGCFAAGMILSVNEIRD